ncbi:hypothetical protein CPLU01_05422 [Colletotrichum plurivorum]|uniref:Uncharacterized protein n=1 Tax=Colletotrichum plurivorum TaxID=2175906 RepID=A0A8H6KMN5_9PEZI|nr:hypothetical protein CPLU01_05422 [Colletotrichum plurivorum]
MADRNENIDQDPVSRPSSNPIPEHAANMSASVKVLQDTIEEAGESIRTAMNADGEMNEAMEAAMDAAREPNKAAAWKRCLETAARAAEASEAVADLSLNAAPAPEDWSRRLDVGYINLPHLSLLQIADRLFLPPSQSPEADLAVSLPPPYLLYDITTSLPTTIDTGRDKMPKPRGKRAHSPEPQAVIGRSQLAYLNQLVKSSLNDSGPRTVTAASNGGSLGVAEVDDAPQILKREAKRLKSEAKGPIKVSWVMNAIPCGEDDSSHIEDVCEQPDSPANNGQRSRDKMASASSRGKEARNEKNKKKKQRGSFGGSSFSSSFTPSTSKQLHSRSAAQSDHESQDESEADYVTSEATQVLSPHLRIARTRVLGTRQ